MTTQPGVYAPTDGIRTRPGDPLSRWLLLGTGLCLFLIGFGFLRTPAALSGSGGILSLAGAAITLLLYGMAGWAGASWLERSFGRDALRLGAIYGLLAGLVYLATFLIEYFTAISGEQDGSLALVEFGSAFFLFFLAGTLAARRDGRIRAGVGAALAAALVSGLVWFILLLLFFIAFQGTKWQEHFYLVNETLTDFQRSGMSDLQAFVLQDFLGAGFFHTLLALITGAIFGALGGAVGKVIKRHGASHE